MFWRAEIGNQRLEGPDHLHPQDADSKPWYVRTHLLIRTRGHWDSPRSSFAVYEVANVGRWRHQLPVVRRVHWDHERDFKNVKELGLFDPGVMDEKIYRVTRPEATEVDAHCRLLLDALKSVWVEHHSVIAQSRTPAMRQLRHATNEWFTFDADAIRIAWDDGRGGGADSVFGELWRLLESICTRKRPLTGWTDGYEIAPDALARMWARNLRPRPSSPRVHLGAHRTRVQRETSAAGKQRDRRSARLTDHRRD